MWHCDTVLSTEMNILIELGGCMFYCRIMISAFVVVLCCLSSVDSVGLAATDLDGPEVSTQQAETKTISGNKYDITEAHSIHNNRYVSQVNGELRSCLTTHSKHLNNQNNF
jgi:hypothetical protein